MRIMIMFLICCSLFAQQGRPFLKAFYHDYGRYSFLVKEGDRVKFSHYNLWDTAARDAEFRFDVPPGHQGWIDTDFNWNMSPQRRCSYFVVHLHTPDELNGAGWSNTVRVVKGVSRTTTGSTTPLE